jgi:hyperosmotically inducible protein
MNKIRPLFALLCLATSALLFAPGCSSTATRTSTGEFIDDSVVTTKVKTDLARDAATPGSAISVETFKGRVLLSGFVDTAEQEAQASVVAIKVSGAKEILNHILVKTSKSTTGVFIDDSVITTKVKAALLKADGVPAAAISVETFRGVVLLSGFVDTAAQRTAAEAVAAKIDNVKDVSNALVLK